MGLFQQRPEERQTWAALPGEPLESDDAVDHLDAPLPDEVFGLGLGLATVDLPAMPTTSAPKDPEDPDDPDDPDGGASLAAGSES